MTPAGNAQSADRRPFGYGEAAAASSVASSAALSSTALSSVSSPAAASQAGPHPAAPPLALPDWLRRSEDYRPPRDRSSFIGRNLTHLGGMLADVGAAMPLDRSPLDRALCAVSPALRLVGVLAVILCAGLTRNMLFAYVMLAVVLVSLAVRPASLIVALLKPALAVCLLSLAVALPAVFVGQYSAPMRLVVRAFVSVTPVAVLALTVPWNRLIGGLRALGVPNAVVYVCDVTIQFVDVLGRSMVELLEALRLRSVGRDRAKLMSAGRLLGVLFLRAHTQARQMAEAMVCRGFSGRYRVRREPWLTWANGCYAVGVVMMVAFAVYCG
ncbi:energy-coupling factor transporter transmembrane component T [Bifidobacterium leontopitheci]|nr:energy-coupling factor transporter transmembrane component T [Bifidobacterium leontopitheci]